MASIRQASDTGAEIKPVEVWLNYGGVPVLMTAQPCSDGGVLTQEGVNVRALSQVQVNGQFERRRAPGTFKPVTLGAATAETTIWTPAAGKKFRLMGFVLTTGAQTVLTFKDNTAGTTIAVVELAANSPFRLDLGNGILSTAANNVLTVTRGTSAALNGTIIGGEE